MWDLLEQQVITRTAPGGGSGQWLPARASAVAAPPMVVIPSQPLGAGSGTTRGDDGGVRLRGRIQSCERRERPGPLAMEGIRAPVSTLLAFDPTMTLGQAARKDPQSLCHHPQFPASAHFQSRI